MVYETARDPSYSKPFCDLCGEKIESDWTLFVIEDGSPKGQAPTGTKRHEGHFCPDCNPEDEMSMSVGYYKFESVNDTIVMVEIIGPGQKSHYRYVPQRMPEPLKLAMDKFIDKEASRLSY